MAKAFAVAIVLYVCFLFCSPKKVSGQSSVSASDLINLINGMRTANGYSALSVDSSLMYLAQNTADTMAANNMRGHIGNASGRAAATGYNNGNTCFATENFMMGTSATSIGQIQAAWSDASHMIPATNGSYCHIGAGVSAEVNGFIYFVVEAAYPGNAASCAYNPAVSSGSTSSGVTGSVSTTDISQIIKNVAIATADADGNIYHEVAEGQTLWSIATAYDTSVEVISAWNNLGESTTLKLGQRLLIPSKEAQGTPTPEVALTIYPTADAAGTYRHTVVDGETLWSISELWKVSLQDLFRVNGLDEDSSIGLGWNLVIPVTATNTIQPTDTVFPTSTLSATEIPSQTPEMSITPITTAALSSGSGSHMPQAGPRTYLIIGIFILVAAGIIILLIGSVTKKK